MLRPSPNHGTQRLPNDDDDDGGSRFHSQKSPKSSQNSSKLIPIF